ncbi:60S acidic ribosomal protein P0-like [Asparagus officinalis]|uniref:60S acidic ribosomal protein P0-like n=1 Tax=Asparagus officinalis TaxID=4686 RepID=UPI00098E05D4|nr:60S acidic ribosomal protein P0-like [Asparagus officinalis]
MSPMGVNVQEAGAYNLHVIDTLDTAGHNLLHLLPWLNIPTKINKVGSSEATLLTKLEIRSFSYELVVLYVDDNRSIFSPEVLNLIEDDIVGKFVVGVSIVSLLSLALSYLTLAAAPHMFINTYENVFAVAIDTKYTFIQVKGVSQGSKKIRYCYRSCYIG